MQFMSYNVTIFINKDYACIFSGNTNLQQNHYHLSIVFLDNCSGDLKRENNAVSS